MTSEFSKYKTDHNYVQDKRTQLWYNPTEQFNKLLQSSEVQAQFRSMA